ncbi:putative SOS response-associated peptidase YedK [Sphingomonas endophytica]|uniref:SOS response-associated peptidase YedK n=1 Tax=Sphingomonas endophytica TaxID=869719 RepID=A0ABR6N9R5_9SPHN|nr:SOS response-associated peptidase family protein [Sphingomonas endophytica]MBB5727535.1 putative SOS response-associated peptidase YedK [Sphingomonas endophytica]
MRLFSSRFWKQGGRAMCNRYRMSEAQAALAARYGVAAEYPPDLTVPPPELFPKRPAWTVRHDDGARILDVMTWGWPRTVPGARGPRETQVTNVRNLDSPMWRNALAKPPQRCLVPVTSFSEYGPGEKGNLPLYWFDVPSRPIFSFAGMLAASSRGRGVRLPDLRAQQRGGTDPSQGDAADPARGG